MTIYNFTMLNVPFANGAISTEIAPFPDWNRGLGIAFDQTEGKPEMKGLNGLFQVMTTSMLYLKQRGISEWDSALEYPANAFVTEGAKLYKSKRTNTAKQPSLSQSDWDVWASISDISVSTNGNLKKTVNSDGSVVLEVPTASVNNRGAMRFATSTEVVNQSSVQAAIQPSDVQNMFSGVKSANGWTKMPNGMIFQWGTVFVGADQTRSVTFPIKFPSAVVNVQVSIISTEVGVIENLIVQQGLATTTGMTLRSRWVGDMSGSLSGFTTNWFAIGY